MHRATNDNRERLISCFTKASRLVAQGYMITLISEKSDVWAIWRPEQVRILTEQGDMLPTPEYLVIKGKCTCPDFTKHAKLPNNNFCKHSMAVDDIKQITAMLKEHEQNPPELVSAGCDPYYEADSYMPEFPMVQFFQK